MMMTRALLPLATLATLAAATPWNTPTTTATSTTTVTITQTAPSGGQTEPASSCSTGELQCCNQVQNASDPATSILLGLLGIVLEGVDALIGLDCSPITVIGVGTGNSCDATAVCCQNNNVGGLISVGCIPVML